MRKRRQLTVLAAVAALGSLLALPAQAATPNVLTYGGAGGSAVAVGDVLTASLAAGTSATLYSTATGTSGVTCATSTFNATVTANPASPDTATESLTGQTFGSCTSNVFGVMSVKSVTVNNLPYTNAVSDAAGNPVTLSPSSASAPIRTTLVLGTLLGTVTCVYQAPGGLAGTTSNSAQTISFGNQAFSKFSGPGTCPSAGYFSASYGPVLDTSQAGSPHVYVN